MEFKRLSQPPDTDTLRIRTKGVESHIQAALTVVSYRDKDTRQIVNYVPTLEISGYGEDEQKAEEMVKFAIKDYFQFLIDLPAKKMKSELSSLGWKINPIKNKEFSHTYVDIRGNLKNFNAVGDKVEVSVLSL